MGSWGGPARRSAVLSTVLAACGLDARGTRIAVEPTISADDAGTASDAPPASEDAAADAAGAEDAADAASDGASEAGDAGCPFLCAGVCVATCAVCTTKPWGCGQECVANCAACGSGQFECMGCVGGTVTPLNRCTSGRDSCNEGTNACACTTRANCPSSQHVCSNNSCLTCNSATGGLGLTCKDGNGCDGQCD